MSRYLLDTGVAGDWINRRLGVHTRVRELTNRGETVGLCVPVVAELFAGVEGSNHPEKNRAALMRGLGKTLVWPFDRAAAEVYGKLFAHLRRAGRPMQQIDIQIAAIAITLGNCTLATKDSDFRAIPGLAVEFW